MKYMNYGQILRLRKVKHYFSDTPGEWVELSPSDRNTVGLFVFIGTADLGTEVTEEQLDARLALAGLKRIRDG